MILDYLLAFTIVLGAIGILILVAFLCAIFREW